AGSAGIVESDLVELDTRCAAPLRAWARLDASVGPGTLPIDRRGLSILKIVEGNSIELRRVGVPARPRVGFAKAAQ
ncbi:MAG: hypothetical protein MUP61_04635, partial [Burkholderiales bacterium]|nr:hypothetical protein [Burkholderiales bacterium]